MGEVEKKPTRLQRGRAESRAREGDECRGREKVREMPTLLVFVGLEAGRERGDEGGRAVHHVDAQLVERLQRAEAHLCRARRGYQGGQGDRRARQGIIVGQGVWRRGCAVHGCVRRVPLLHGGAAISAAHSFLSWSPLLLERAVEARDAVSWHKRSGDMGRDACTHRETGVEGGEGEEGKREEKGQGGGGGTDIVAAVREIVEVVLGAPIEGGRLGRVQRTSRRAKHGSRRHNTLGRP